MQRQQNTRSCDQQVPFAGMSAAHPALPGLGKVPDSETESFPWVMFSEDCESGHGEKVNFALLNSFNFYGLRLRKEWVTFLIYEVNF